MATLIFTHGWGFDHHLWDGVRSRLTPFHHIETVDFGFFGAPHVPRLPKVGTGDTPIAIGHSLGACWWLAQATIPWARLLIINGFPRFTECDGYAPTIAPRLLARMQTQFSREPAQVLVDFHTRCGAAPRAVAPDTSRLGAGLQWLAEWDGRAMLAERGADIHVLAGSVDPIVPRAMTTTAFAALSADRLTWNDTPGHVLPLTAPAACARWIEAHLHG